MLARLLRYNAALASPLLLRFLYAKIITRQYSKTIKYCFVGRD